MCLKTQFMHEDPQISIFPKADILWGELQEKELSDGDWPVLLQVALADHVCHNSGNYATHGSVLKQFGNEGSDRLQHA